MYGEEYETFLRLMGSIRKKLLNKAHDPEAHKPIFEQLVKSGLVDKIREDNQTDINYLLREILGDGYLYEELMNVDK